MAVDYDVVILGGTPLGREVALRAAQWEARVALVEPPIPVMQQQWQTQALFPILRALGQAGGWRPGYAPTPLGQSPDPSSQTPKDWGLWAQEQARQAAHRLQEDTSIARLASAGVDMLQGDALFSRRTQFGVAVGARLLRSRTYLLLLPRQTLLPALPGLDSARPLIPEDLADPQFWENPPQRLLILGGGAIACELAQTLAQIGLQITLVSETPLLPTWEPSVAMGVQVWLEAVGVRVVAPTPIQSIWEESGEKLIQTEIGAIATDAILATGPTVSHLAALNPAVANIALNQGFIPTNSRYQTSNPRIYACDTDAPTARHRAQIALKNALFLPIFRDRQPPLQICQTDPPAVAWGLTHAQAQQRYGSKVQVLHWTTQAGAMPGKITLPIAPRSDTYQLILKPNGQILGAHCRAPQIEEWLGILALAQQHRLPLQALATLPLISPSFAAILQTLAWAWQAQRLNQVPWFKARLNQWFDNRRDRIL